MIFLFPLKVDKTALYNCAAIKKTNRNIYWSKMRKNKNYHILGFKQFIFKRRGGGGVDLDTGQYF